MFLTAKTVSDIGYALDFICLSVFIWVRTGSTLATGLVSLVLYSGRWPAAGWRTVTATGGTGAW